MVTTFTYIVLFLICSWGIFKTDQKSESLSKSVFIAIFLGAIIGISLHFIPETSSETVIEWYNIAGNGYVNLLKLVDSFRFFQRLISSKIALVLARCL